MLNTKRKHKMATRDTYKYRIKDGNRIVYYGTTNDLERREREHRSEGMDFTKMEKIGNITTSAAAGAWEEGEIKRYKQQHGGDRPKYNQNDTGK